MASADASNRHSTRQWSKPVALRSPWDHRLRVTLGVGTALGFGMGIAITVPLELRGNPAVIGAFGPILLGLIAGYLYGKRMPYWSEAQIDDGQLILRRSSFKQVSIPLHEVLAVESRPLSLVALVEAPAMPMDLHTTRGVYRLWGNTSHLGDLRDGIVDGHAGAIDFREGCEMLVPAPADFRLRDEIDTAARQIARLLGRSSRKALLGAVASLAVAIGLVVVMYFAVTEAQDEGRGIATILIVLIFPVAILGGCLWTLWRNVWRKRGFIRQLRLAGERPEQAVTTSDGRVVLFIDESTPDEITASTKRFCLLGVVFSAVPVIGLLLAARGLYFTWERKGIWNSVAWMGMISGCVLNGCYALLYFLD